MYSGIVNIYKEKGFTSFDVVAKMRGIFGQKKIGHTGTLDPDATGVLPVCLGKATKVCDMLTDTDKTYRAVMRLGVSTDTLDMTGTVLETADVDGITEEQVREAVASFTGEIEQIPPMYSAIKISGKKLYELARKGIEVERPARKVTIYDIQIEDISIPLITMSVSCSKGTYIRSLCSDIGEKLGCHGAMESLVRTRAAGFYIEDAMTLDEVQKLKDEGKLDSIVNPVETVFSHLTQVTVNEEGNKKLMNGNSLIKEDMETEFDGLPEEIALYDIDHIFRAVYKYNEEKQAYKPAKMFL